jgi:glycosyltransferase involved in cell wall biosynthesis
MAEWGIREWGLDRKRVRVVPNPHIPSKDLLDIPITKNRKVVGFFGRLEYRKGICRLIDAIPRILEGEPDAHFRFVGKPLLHPDTLEPFDSFILRKLKRFKSNITIVGAVPLDRMPAEYEKVDVCVFPSVWENFPYVCLEAMSAAKAVVASAAGGMSEMLDGDCGIVVEAENPGAIADAVIRLLRSDDLRIQMGGRSRARVLERYSKESIGPQIEASYKEAISANLARKGEPVAS